MYDFPVLRLPSFYPGQMGVSGSDVSLGIRTMPTSKVLFVDYAHPDSSDNNDGTNPEAPLETIQAAVNKLENNFDVIVVRSISPTGESVVTGDYTTTPNYVRLIGAGSTRYSPFWISDSDTAPCLDLRTLGWTIEGFRFGAPTQSSCIELRHTDTGANDIAIRTIIKGNLFDGQTTGRYGIVSHGCYDVWVVDNVFQLFHNAVAGGAIPLAVDTTPLAIPYRNHVINNVFWDCDNGVVFPCNGCEFVGNRFQPIGYAYSMTGVLITSIIANPGDDNIIFGNLFPGDYSIAGGYTGGTNDHWAGNWASDVAETEVGDNGLTLLPPA